MSEKSIEVRQSKIYTILTCIGALIIIVFFLGLSIFALYSIVNGDYSENSDQFSGDIFAFCFSLIIVFIIITMIIWVVFVYKKQIDLYTNDKIIRKRRKKVIFELPYENIVTIREGFESVFMVLKTHITEANGKKGTRNFYAHYSRADISRIKNIITDKYYNIPFN